MSTPRFHVLGPLLAGEGSRALLGLELMPDEKAEPCVIIWVPEAAESDAALLARIRKETEHAANLDHPNIVNVRGFGTLGDRHARVVEFADGESLRRVLELGKKLPLAIAARILCDACTGVHYAHVAGNDDGSPLVHADLRPETVLISFAGTTKVTGYGALAFAPREAGGQRVKGRRVHSAPEQIIGGREACTVPTDVYLLGLMLYECLAGTVPWSDQGDFFDQAVLTLPLAPATPGDIPDALQKVLERACSKKAKERYATPLELREAIETAVGEPLASPEAVAAHLASLIPESHLVRADRRHTIDAGIAEYVRKLWAEKEASRAAAVAATPAPSIAPAPPEAPAPAAPTTPAAPPSAAAAPAKAPAPAEPKPFVPTELPRSERVGMRFPFTFVTVTLAVIVALWFGIRHTDQPLPTARAYLEEVDAGAEPEAPDAGAPTAVADALSDAGTAEADAGAEVDAGVAEAAVPQDIDGVIDCSPDVDVVLEGTVLGRTPWKGRLPVGKHRVQLKHAGLGISQARTVTVAAPGPFSERFTIERGTVGVSAPKGAGIFIDGNRVGTAPLKADLNVYEGYHRIQVTVGKAKWNETFTLYGNQRVSFTVELE